MHRAVHMCASFHGMERDCYCLLAIPFDSIKVFMETEERQNIKMF